MNDKPLTLTMGIDLAKGPDGTAYFYHCTGHGYTNEPCKCHQYFELRLKLARAGMRLPPLDIQNILNEKGECRQALAPISDVDGKDVSPSTAANVSEDL